MLTQNCVRYFHHKPPHRTFTRFCCGNVRKTDLSSCYDEKAMQKTEADEAMTGSGACHTASVNFDDDTHTEQEDQYGGLPLTPETTPVSDFSAKEQIAKAMMEAANRMMEAVTHFIGAMDAKDRADPCGLLRFREWWELVEVKISVDGNLISGIPIFIKEDVLRVVDNNYSYFIPLAKVGYIRTNDGLSAPFDASNRKPV